MRKLIYGSHSFQHVLYDWVKCIQVLLNQASLIPKVVRPNPKIMRLTCISLNHRGRCVEKNGLKSVLLTLLQIYQLEEKDTYLGILDSYTLWVTNNAIVVVRRIWTSLSYNCYHLHMFDDPVLRSIILINALVELIIKAYDSNSEFQGPLAYEYQRESPLALGCSPFQSI